MKMTKQEIFDKVAVHLLKQGRRSMRDLSGGRGERCAYRGRDGSMCAAGCLIPDEKYDPNMEGSVWGYFNTTDIAEEVGQIDLVEDLQVVHDIKPVQEWRQNLEEIASQYGLTTDCLKQFDTKE